MNQRGLMLFIVVLFAGCASQKSPNATAPDFSCLISPQNVERMCLMAADALKLHPDQFKITEATEAGPFGNERRPTKRIDWGVKTPSGEYASEVNCDLNIELNSVVYARLLGGPKTKVQADYLQSQGFCSD